MAKFCMRVDVLRVFLLLLVFEGVITLEQELVATSCNHLLQEHSLGVGTVVCGCGCVSSHYGGLVLMTDSTYLRYQ